jgi:predicted DNA-binding transcriptional regulator AlpA
MSKSKASKTPSHPRKKKSPRPVLSPARAAELGLPDLVTRKELAAYCAVRPAALHEMPAQDASFPKPIVLTPRRVVYRKEDVMTWLRGRGLLS